ncbi:nucleotidyltransferase [uncultured Limosilactobacillus sp.]|uniref:nucleotidyltransferase n=1 Tax=uncultured Limosilactobacillus sp. TaxID=2837629 RepID=UPI0025E58455|nr:nucleotidyltransferase [uncultured Limosilactobacillus sp.]
MKAVGLVAEYNPFHNGHRYHRQQAQQVTNADVVVAVMSGNFTQRGVPTIVDKWHRTREALQNGVDLVVELPLFYAVQPAHLFAAGALRLLAGLGVHDVVFGAEHPHWDFRQLVAAEKDFQTTSFHRYNATFATQFNQELAKRTGHQLTAPNDILAFAYQKAQEEEKLPIALHAIERVGSAYHDHHLGGKLASATAIRDAVAAGHVPEHAVPPQTAADLREVATVPTWDRLYPLLRNQLIQAPVARLAETYEVAEGLEYRMKDAAERSLDFLSFQQAVKSKRYTYARLLRAELYLLLQASAKEVEAAMEQPYYHVLGFTKAGQRYLHQVKKELPYPLIVKVDQNLKRGLMNLDYRAGKLYQVFTSREQDLKRPPQRL